MSDRRIRITAGDVCVTARLNDSATADLVWDALPLEASGNTWGDEIYFRIAVNAGEEDGASDVVEMGARWRTGRRVRRCACSSGARRRAEATKYGRRAQSIR